ncbi:hypothetical protein ElyMa_004249700 [Elysia marginata]|uniref:Uncharacterized protein n=1 Tax=Elysia marginata TaxID=1093978 RepID=A0AAV4GSU2_9GAST|nr:hypothetical protein ElyMa_004249700 [Elysia marginata]
MHPGAPQPFVSCFEFCSNFMSANDLSRQSDEEEIHYRLIVPRKHSVTCGYLARLNLLRRDVTYRSLLEFSFPPTARLAPEVVLILCKNRGQIPLETAVRKTKTIDGHNDTRKQRLRNWNCELNHQAVSPNSTKMSLRRLRPEHYKQLLAGLLPISGVLFGAYQQFLHDHDHVLYRNKSKLFGGKQLPEGKEAWY